MIGYRVDYGEMDDLEIIEMVGCIEEDFRDYNLHKKFDDAKQSLIEQLEQEVDDRQQIVQQAIERLDQAKNLEVEHLKQQNISDSFVY